MDGLCQRYQGLFGGRADPDEDGAKGDAGGFEQYFGERWGWFVSGAQVAELERIPLQQAYALPVIHFLNDLAFLKDRVQYDEIKMEQWRVKHNSNRS